MQARAATRSLIHPSPPSKSRSLSVPFVDIFCVGRVFWCSGSHWRTDVRAAHSIMCVCHLVARSPPIFPGVYNTPPLPHPAQQQQQQQKRKQQVLALAPFPPPSSSKRTCHSSGGAFHPPLNDAPSLAGWHRHHARPPNDSPSYHCARVKRLRFSARAGLRRMYHGRFRPRPCRTTRSCFAS